MPKFLDQLAAETSSPVPKLDGDGDLPADLTKLSLEELMDLPVGGQWPTDAEESVGGRSRTEDLPADLTKLSLEELMDLRAGEGEKPEEPDLEDPSLSGDLPADLTTLRLAQLMNFRVTGQSLQESEKSHENPLSKVATSSDEVNPDRNTGPAAPASNGGGAEFNPFASESLIEVFSLGLAYADLDGGDPLGHGGLVPNIDVTHNFEFPDTVSDGNGGSDTATFTVNLSDYTSEAAVGPIGDADPAANGEFSVGAVSDADPAANSVSESAANGTAVGITALAGDADATDTVTYALTDDASGRFAIDANSGVVTVADASLLDYETQSSHTIEVTAASSDGSTSTQSFTINVADDNDQPNPNDEGPGTLNDTGTADELIPLNSNVVIVFDRSGSMTADPSVDGFSQRIDLARAAVASLLAAADTAGDVNVLIVDFGTDAATSGWVTVDEANAYLSSLVAGGFTDYEEAADLVQTAFQIGFPGALDQNVLYWLSDGNPTTGSFTGSEVSDWETFLTDNDMQAIAVGVGGGVTESGLEPVAFPNGDPDNPIVVTNESQLIDTLLGTLAVGASGNVLDGADEIPDTSDAGEDDFGTDGRATPPITQFVHDGITYTPATGVGGTVISNAGGVIVITTAPGAEFEFDFNNGDYTYTTNANGGASETFEYTIEDGDGDFSSAVLTIDVPVTPDIAGLPLIAGTDGSDTLDGTIEEEILAGGDGVDTLNGGGGKDLLFGGDGVDTLNGGPGDDILLGGEGDDVLIWDPVDTTIDGGSGTDTLRVDSGDVDLTTFAGTIQGIEQIDLEADAGVNTATLTMSDVLDMSDTDTLTILGDVGDSLDAGTGWTDGGIVGEFHVYSQGAATLLLDQDLTVNPDITT